MDASPARVQSSFIQESVAPYTPQSVRSGYASASPSPASTAAPTPDKLQASIPVVMVRTPRPADAFFYGGAARSERVVYAADTLRAQEAVAALQTLQVRLCSRRPSRACSQRIASRVLTHGCLIARARRKRTPASALSWSCFGQPLLPRRPSLRLPRPASGRAPRRRANHVQRQLLRRRRST